MFMTDQIRKDFLLSKEWGLPERSDEGIYYRWSSDKSRIHVLDSNVYTNIKFRIYNGTRNIKDRVLKIFIDDAFYKEYMFSDGIEYIDTQFNVNNVKCISFETPHSFKPNLLDSRSTDTRKLGFKFYAVLVDTKTLTDVIIPIKDIERLNTDDLHIKTLNDSIFKQNDTAQIINLPYNKKNFYFNPCIFNFNDVTYLLTRHTELLSYNKTVNKLKLFELGSHFNVKREVLLNIKDELYAEQYEDPRVLVHNDKLYISCVNYQFNNYKFVHQKMMVFNRNFVHIKNIHPEYDGNGKDAHSNTGNQKNWTWFVHDNKLMCVYRMSPHIIVEFDEQGTALTEYRTFVDINKVWNYGECRMGTNPILKDGYYHNFFHSSIPWKEPKRQYFMGYYKFESEPPFRIIELSEKPILWGNEADDRILPEFNPIVVFPCGAILKDNKFVVSFGLNDEKTGIIEI